MNSYIDKIYSNRELLDSKKLVETTLCIKGIDYENRPTWNESTWIRDLGEGAYAKVILA